MGRHPDSLLARAVNVALAPKYSQKSRAVSETLREISGPAFAPRALPVPLAYLSQPSAEPERELFEGTIAIALAGSFAPKLAIKQRLGTDGEDDSNNLQPHREAERVELSNRPRHDLGYVVERHPQQVLDLLRRRPMPPPAWEIGDARHTWENDDVVVLVADAELALSLERGACHRLGYMVGAER
jgi:hypothetical protein